MTEIRAHDLAFTSEETVELLAAHELELAETSLAALHARTEGWAAGLRMAALGLQRVEDKAGFVAEFAGDDRIVGDYLVEEILEHLPAHERRFLLRTSIAGRLCAGLAEAITGEPAGDEMLERLARTNGFVLELEGSGGWFRYHTLFAELLRARLRHGSREDERACHRAAARWYAAQGMRWEALRHAGWGQDTELAAELLAEDWLELFAGGQRDQLRAALDELPGERVDADPELSAAAACARFDSGQPDRAREHLDHAGDGTAAALALACAARHDGDVVTALAAADTISDGDTARAVANLAIGVGALWSFDFECAEARLRLALSHAGGAAADHLRLDALAHLALTRALCEGPAAAAAAAAEAAELARRPEWAGTSAVAATHAALAHIALSESRAADAEGHWARASHAHPEPGLRLELDRLGALIRLIDRHRGSLPAMHDDAPPANPQNQAVAGALRVRVLLARGDIDAARAILHTLPDTFAEVAVAGAELALADGVPDAAPTIAGPALMGSTLVEAHVATALILDAQGRRAEATSRMEQALQAAETTGHRAALSRQPAIQPLLQACIRAGTAHRSLAGEVLQAIEDQHPARAVASPFLDELTDREREVLAYLPTTSSNRDIAAELGVSTNTIKTHLRGIYRKLQAENRRDAVTRARSCLSLPDEPPGAASRPRDAR